MSDLNAKPEFDEPRYQNDYVDRGRIFPVRHGELPRARCGECGIMFEMPPRANNITDALWSAHWRYELVNGWVCADCAPLPRLAQGEPNRAPKGGV